MGPNYYIIKRNSVLNLSPKNSRAKGKQWYTETKANKRPSAHLPAGSKCERNDIVYIYIVGYGIVGQGKVIEKKITVLNNFSEVFAFINFEVISKTGARAVQNLGGGGRPNCARGQEERMLL